MRSVGRRQEGNANLSARTCTGLAGLHNSRLPAAARRTQLNTSSKTQAPDATQTASRHRQQPRGAQSPLLRISFARASRTPASPAPKARARAPSLHRRLSVRPPRRAERSRAERPRRSRLSCRRGLAAPLLLVLVLLLSRTLRVQRLCPGADATPPPARPPFAAVRRRPSAPRPDRRRQTPPRSAGGARLGAMAASKSAVIMDNQKTAQIRETIARENRRARRRSLPQALFFLPPLPPPPLARIKRCAFPRPAGR